MVHAQDAAARCVDQQFAALSLSGRTAADKAASYLTSHPYADLPAFSTRTHLAWCRELGRADEDLRAFWPALQGDIILTTGAQADARKAMLERAATLMRDRFLQDWGAPLAGRFAIIGGGSDAELNTLLRAARAQMGQSTNARINSARFCGHRHAGAFAGRGLIGFCWPVEGQPVTLGGLLAVMGHEMMHQAQYDLALDVPARKLSDGSDRLLGPGWLVEGSAEVIELSAKGIEPSVTGSAFFNVQNGARRSRILLSDLTRSDAVKTSEQYGVARFAAMLLARKHGRAALFTYFDALGRSADRDVAFQTAFGQSFYAFEAEFEAVRRDFRAAQAYGSQ
ncbi:MAG: hypothetical protein ABJL99_13990 [Aliishimia sp.]